MTRVNAVAYPNQVITIEEASKKPDNPKIYETVAYRYNGLDAVKELLADGAQWRLSVGIMARASMPIMHWSGPCLKSPSLPAGWSSTARYFRFPWPP